MAAAAGATLPAEYLATASADGIKKSVVAAYLALQANFATGWLSKTLPWFRDRLVYDNRFLFKVGAEVCPRRCSITHHRSSSCMLQRASAHLHAQ
jgi:hypothetical protein